MSEDALLRAYDENLPALTALAEAVQTRIEQVLGEDALTVHSITRRVKSRESLARKLSRPDRIYRQLEDVTDLVGVRIVTYFDDATYEVAGRIERAFQIDLAHSADKRRLLAPTQFGYRSLHYVCRLPGHPPIPFEVQIRTILQHAWAEIEHDLGYKSAASVPSVIRRRFSRLAGLLELADEEFLSIRRELKAYEESLRQSSPDALRRVSLDPLSLEAFVSSERVQRADRAVSELLGLPLDDRLFFPDYLVRMLAEVGLGAVEPLSDAFAAHESQLLAFVPHYFDFAQETWNFSSRNLDRVYRGYSLVFLAHLAVLDGGDLELDRAEQVTNFFEALDYPGDRERSNQVARKLIEAHRRHQRGRALRSA